AGGLEIDEDRARVLIQRKQKSGLSVGARVVLKRGQPFVTSKMERPRFDLHKTAPTLAEEAQQLFGSAGYSQRGLASHKLDELLQSVHLRAARPQIRKLVFELRFEPLQLDCELGFELAGLAFDLRRREMAQSLSSGAGERRSLLALLYSRLQIGDLIEQFGFAPIEQTEPHFAVAAVEIRVENGLLFLTDVTEFVEAGIDAGIFGFRLAEDAFSPCKQTLVAALTQRIGALMQVYSRIHVIP